MMTKKHFQAFADEIARTKNKNDKRNFAKTCAAIFTESNPRFDMVRFFEACGFSAKTKEELCMTIFSGT